MFGTVTLFTDGRYPTDAVTVTNVAPTATFGNDGPVDEGSSFHLSLTNPSDPSSADTSAGFTYSFDCGDATGYSTFSSDATAACPTSDDGTRSVKAKIRDKDGGTTAYTDTGHEAASAVDATWANGSMTRKVDFFDRGIHVATVAAKAVTQAFYEKRVEKRTVTP